MIPRYTLKEMEEIWTDQNRYNIWLKIELTICRILSKYSYIPKAVLSEIEARAGFDIARIEEIEKETKHDVIAFLVHLAERIGPASRFIHLGLTSSDILDTTYAIQLRDSVNLIIKTLDKLLTSLKNRAIQHKYTLMVGRTHGVHAEPITFGLKLAGFYAEFKRNHKRLIKVRPEISRGKLSGAVGTYTYLPPEIEAEVMHELGLTPAIGSTQVVARDGIADYFCNLALLGGAIERLSIEIRHLQRSEVLEVEEEFVSGQKGSSAMPHKRNPISSENLSGQARLTRSYAIAALENIALWHERDISHSSVERVISPDSNIIIYYSLHRMVDLIEKLIVYPSNMIKNLNLTDGLIYSQQILLMLIQKGGMPRMDAYRLIQKNALFAREKNKTFKNCLLNDIEILTALGSKAKEILESLFNPWRYLGHLDYIFKQILDD